MPQVKLDKHEYYQMTVSGSGGELVDVPQELLDRHLAACDAFLDSSRELQHLADAAWQSGRKK